MPAGRNIVITGATSGIGQAGAERLASMGARIIQIARDRGRGEAAIDRLRSLGPGGDHAIYYADLSKIGETRRVASEISAAEPRIDVLINNAGAIFGKRELTEDGLERTFALNHMAYFVLTHCLLERLLASAPARIINTASDAHQSGMVDFDDLQSEKIYRGTFLKFWRNGGPAFKVYANSKLCNILFTRQLAKGVKGSGVTVNCFHPGFVNTRFGDAADGLIPFGIRIAKRFARPLMKGAETLVYLAASPELSNITGEYFQDCRSIQPSAAAQDEALAERLWMESSRLAGL